MQEAIRKDEGGGRKTDVVSMNADEVEDREQLVDSPRRDGLLLLRGRSRAAGRIRHGSFSSSSSSSSSSHETQFLIIHLKKSISSQKQ